MQAELIERNSYLQDLTTLYHQIEGGTAHTVFLTGEAGIGKTALLNGFLNQVKDTSIIYNGACDSLFTPRPLGPLYDIALQIGDDFLDLLKREKDRSLLFSSFIQTIASSPKPVVLVFEDIHWADEATIDLIKFLARRIARLKCLFLLTYRDEEVPVQHPLKNIFGDLPAGSFSKVKVNALSFEAVAQLAKAKGYESVDQLYSLTGGNPFYVTEVLANPDSVIPERVKDSVLTTFHKREERAQNLWEILSILPSRIDFNIMKHIEPGFPSSMETCINSGVIVIGQDHLRFKHELFRIAIEESLSFYKKKDLHQRIVQIMLDHAEEIKALPQLVHHALHAGDGKTVATFAPRAAEEAASLGAHLEATKLYKAAILYTDQDQPSLVTLYEKYAYECYLINQIDMAIDLQQRVLDIWRERKVSIKEGDALRFLSRLWWFKGDHDKYMYHALKSIEVLDTGAQTHELAFAYSNLSQLCMLADKTEETLRWGRKAIDLATKMSDIETLSHALNNIGAVLMRCVNSQAEGEETLNKSLYLALDNGFHEHVARSRTNLGSNYVIIRNYKKAAATFELGLKYCEIHNLDSWTYYILSWKARMLFETGEWKEAEALSEQLQTRTNHPEAGIVRVGALITLAKLKLRTGEFEKAKLLIKDAKSMAMPTREPQRIIPVLALELELHWFTGEPFSIEDVEFAIRELFPDKNNCWQYSELIYWLNKNKLSAYIDGTQYVGPYHHEVMNEWATAAEVWKNLGCPYEEALALMDGNSEQQTRALVLFSELGATSAREMLRSKLKLKGVKIPRGPRESTRINPAMLTQRQVHVLRLLEHGLHNNEIADKLFISPKTVDHHISAILSKLEVNSRAKAVVEARKLGVLK